MKNIAFVSLVLLLVASCTPVCGNGSVETSEGCDDGNAFDGDGCSSTCRVESGYACRHGTECDPVCGDHFVADAEVCDPTADAYTYCSSDCMTYYGKCGDGIVQPGLEQCDDMNSVGNDGCSNRCSQSFGFTCVDNVCDASTVDGTKTLGSLTDEEQTSVCTWLVATLGGAGSSHNCSGVVFEVYSVEYCTWTLADAGADCTVSQLEGWVAANGSICRVATSTAATVCQ